MSINVPEKLSKQEYNGLLNDLKKFDLTKYTDLIKENYKKPKGETEYSLKDGIAEPIRINLDYRNVVIDGVSQRIDNIKVSRGEENIFIWCFFLAIMQLVVDKVESYDWVQYIYIDDPISSLDDNNAIAVASHLATLMSGADIKVIVSTHHALFYNVLCNEIAKAERLFFQKLSGTGYILKDTSKTQHYGRLLTNCVAQ